MWEWSGKQQVFTSQLSLFLFFFPRFCNASAVPIARLGTTQMSPLQEEACKELALFLENSEYVVPFPHCIFVTSCAGTVISLTLPKSALQSFLI